MKLTPDTRIIRKAAESLRETNLSLSIPQAIHQASVALEVVREAEYRVLDDAYERGWPDP